MMKRARADLSRFPGMRLPSTDFEAVRDDLAIPYLFDTIDLSTARSIAAGTSLTKSWKGNSFYIDQNADVGNATAIFHDPAVLSTTPGRIYVQPGFNAAVPFDQVTLENVAQPGKVLRVFYGVDIDFKPGNTNSVTIAGTINTQEQGYAYAASYASNTAKLANTPDTVFAPGSNPNGAIVWEAMANMWGSTLHPNFAYLAKAGAAPASVIDGDPILIGVQTVLVSAGVNLASAQLNCPVKIAANKGLYYIASEGEGTPPHRSVLYTLL
jgi:hypothetical protein